MPFKDAEAYDKQQELTIKEIISIQKQIAIVQKFQDLQGKLMERLQRKLNGILKIQPYRLMDLNDLKKWARENKIEGRTTMGREDFLDEIQKTFEEEEPNININSDDIKSSLEEIREGYEDLTKRMEELGIKPNK